MQHGVAENVARVGIKAVLEQQPKKSRVTFESRPVPAGGTRLWAQRSSRGVSETAFHGRGGPARERLAA